MPRHSEPLDRDKLDPGLEIAILKFWAKGATITQRFSRAEILSVPGLAEAIEAVNALPSVIGWGDEEPWEPAEARASRRTRGKRDT